MGKLAAEFTVKYPDVQLEVTTDDREVDMIEEAYDLVIRVNPQPNETLVGRAFLRDRLVVVAGPALARAMGNAAVPTVVRGSTDSATEWKIKSADGNDIVRVEPILHLSSMIMVRDAVLTGIGAARLPISLVSHDLAAGRLVHWGDVDAPEIALWTLYPSRRLLSARVSAFLEHLKQSFPIGTPDELAAYVGR